MQVKGSNRILGGRDGFNRNHSLLCAEKILPNNEKVNRTMSRLMSARIS